MAVTLCFGANLYEVVSITLTAAGLSAMCLFGVLFFHFSVPLVNTEKNLSISTSLQVIPGLIFLSFGVGLGSVATNYGKCIDAVTWDDLDFIRLQSSPAACHRKGLNIVVIIMFRFLTGLGLLLMYASLYQPIPSVVVIFATAFLVLHSGVFFFFTKSKLIDSVASSIARLTVLSVMILGEPDTVSEFLLRTSIRPFVIQTLCSYPILGLVESHLQPTQRFSSILAGAIWDVSMVLYMGHGRLELHATVSICLLYFCCLIGHHMVLRRVESERWVEKKRDHGGLKDTTVTNRGFPPAKIRARKVHRPAPQKVLEGVLQVPGSNKALEKVEFQQTKSSEAFKNLMACHRYKPVATLVDLRRLLRCICGGWTGLHVAKSVPRQVHLDALVLRYILETYISNAVAFGGVQFRPYLKVRSGAHGEIHFAVVNAPGSSHWAMVEAYRDSSAPLFEVGDRDCVDRDIRSSGTSLHIAAQCSKYLNATVDLVFLPDRVESIVTMRGISSSPVDCRLPGLLPVPILIGALDDSAGIRMIFRQLFKRIGAHPGSLECIRGATSEEIAGFPEWVMGYSPCPAMVLLDEHLDHPGDGDTPGEGKRGTDIIKRLRELGYRGKCVICSANNTVNDVKKYRQMGADGVLGKDMMYDSETFTRQCMEIMEGTTTEEAAVTSLSNPDKMDRVDYYEMVDIFELFTKETEQCMRHLTKLFDNKHQPDTYYREARSHLHRLKGASLAVGLKGIADTCEQVKGLEGRPDSWVHMINYLMGQLHSITKVLLSVKKQKEHISLLARSHTGLTSRSGEKSRHPLAQLRSETSSPAVSVAGLSSGDEEGDEEGGMEIERNESSGCIENKDLKEANTRKRNAQSQLFGFQPTKRRVVSMRNVEGTLRPTCRHSAQSSAE